jgi:hypothetical protein
MTRQTLITVSLFAIIHNYSQAACGGFTPDGYPKKMDTTPRSQSFVFTARSHPNHVIEAIAYRFGLTPYNRMKTEGDRILIDFSLLPAKEGEEWMGQQLGAELKMYERGHATNPWQQYAVERRPPMDNETDEPIVQHANS